MPTIYWLDDEPERLDRLVDHVQGHGFDVRIFEHEDSFIRALDADGAPHIAITDLGHDPSVLQVQGGNPRAVGGPFILAGWKLYQETLRPCFPELPVIIHSLEAWIPKHKELADDYNLSLLQVGDTAPWQLEEAFNRVLSSQLPLVRRVADVPALIFTDFASVNEALLKHLSNHPPDIHRLNWATFEELVARLLAELGYEVERTKLTRDGGVDLWAIQHSHLGDTLYAIDAKKYSPDRLVGPVPVRAIHGVISHSDASVGMIVTTSRFGPSATDYARQHRYRLALHDFDDVQTWIRRVVGGSTT